MTVRVPVESGQGAYDVVIGRGLLAAAGDEVGRGHSGRRALLVADDAVANTHAAVVAESLTGAGWEIGQTNLRAEEPCKTIDAVERIWSAALAMDLDRQGLVIAVGGGLTGDVAGFAAASYLRGVALTQVPTTLLSMVDASIGGKTAVNIELPQGGLGKNLAGAFWPPRLVLADIDALSTLPQRERISGLAECVKHGLIADRPLLEFLASEAATLCGEAWSCETADAAQSLVERAVTVKREIVQQDERESGVRMHLNLGHTFAHAIEPDASLDLTHGEAVSVGLVAAAAASAELGLVPAETVEMLRATLRGLRLPTTIATSREPEDLRRSMRHDKKMADGRLRLVLLDGEGVIVRDDIDDGVVEDAWRAVIQPG